MKDKIGSKRHKLGVFIGSLANALLFITVIVLQVMVIWNIGLMLFGSEESNYDEVVERNEAMRHNTQPIKETVFNQRRFEVEVVQPHQEMLEKFSNHPNLVFNKLSKAIQKEDKRIKDIRKEIFNIRTKLGISTNKSLLSKEISSKNNADADGNKTDGSSSWFGASSNFSGRKLKQISGNVIIDEKNEEPLYLDTKSKEFYFNENFDSDTDITSQSKQKDDIKIYQQCPKKSPLLLGPIFVQQKNIPTLLPGTKKFKDWYGHTLAIGGASVPKTCIARQKVAILVPYRDRKDNLDIFLHHLHPVLQRQQLDYRIFVIEQSSDEQFNRAALMNIGYIEANKLDRYFCFVFHDVDLLPEDDRNLYQCPPDSDMSVKHLNVATNRWKYRLQYKNYLGGVSAISKIHFKRMNGFPNGFYGWGGEDDELAQRCNQTQLDIIRQPGNIARYTMLTHKRATSNTTEVRHLMHLSKDLKLLEDGLSTITYKVLRKENLPLYTKILVRLPSPDDLPKKELYIADSGEVKTTNDDNNLKQKDSPFMVAMLKNVGSLATAIGKSAAKEVLLYSLQHAEKQEEKENGVY